MYNSPFGGLLGPRYVPVNNAGFATSTVPYVSTGNFAHGIVSPPSPLDSNYMLVRKLTYDPYRGWGYVTVKERIPLLEEDKNMTEDEKKKLKEKIEEEKKKITEKVEEENKKLKLKVEEAKLKATEAKKKATEDYEKAKLEKELKVKEAHDKVLVANALALEEQKNAIEAHNKSKEAQLKAKEARYKAIQAQMLEAQAKASPTLLVNQPLFGLNPFLF